MGPNGPEGVPARETFARENILQKIKAVMSFTQTCQTIINSLKNRNLIIRKRRRKRGLPEFAGISVDVYENKRQLFSVFSLENMLMKTNDFLFLENICMKIKGIFNSRSAV